MKAVVAGLLAVAVVVLGAAPAVADCASEFALLKARLAHERNPEILAAVRKHVRQAEIELNGSESACRNAVTRGWRAYKAAQADVADAEAKQAAARRAR